MSNLAITTTSLNSFLIKSRTIATDGFSNDYAFSIRTNDNVEQCEFWRLLVKLGNQCVDNYITCVQMQVKRDYLAVLGKNQNVFVQCHFERTNCNFSWECARNVEVYLNKQWFETYIQKIKLLNPGSAVYLESQNTFQWTLRQQALNSQILIPLLQSGYYSWQLFPIHLSSFNDNICVRVDKDWLFETCAKYLLHGGTCFGLRCTRVQALADDCLVVNCQHCCQCTWMANYTYIDPLTVSHKINELMHRLYPLIEIDSLIAIIVDYLRMPQKMPTLQACSIGISEFRIIKDLLESNMQCRTVELYFNKESMKVWINPTVVIIIDTPSLF